MHTSTSQPWTCDTGLFSASNSLHCCHPPAAVMTVTSQDYQWWVTSQDYQWWVTSQDYQWWVTSHDYQWWVTSQDYQWWVTSHDYQWWVTSQDYQWWVTSQEESGMVSDQSGLNGKWPAIIPNLKLVCNLQRLGLKRHTLNLLQVFY